MYQLHGEIQDVWRVVVDIEREIPKVKGIGDSGVHEDRGQEGRLHVHH